MTQVSTAQKKLTQFKKELWGEMKANDVSAEYLAEALGITKRTLYQKRKEPERFTVRELLILQDVFPNMSPI